MEELFRDHSHRVLSFALRWGATPAEAEDVVADTFLVAWRHLDERPRRPEAWLVGIAYKVLANQRRSRLRRQAFDDRARHWEAAGVSATTDPADDLAARARVLVALDLLSEQEREAVLLVAWQGLSHAEAAEVLGCSRNAFTLRFYRARHRLMKHLGRVRTLSV